MISVGWEGEFVAGFGLGGGGGHREPGFAAENDNCFSYLWFHCSDFRPVAPAGGEGGTQGRWQRV